MPATNTISIKPSAFTPSFEQPCRPTPISMTTPQKNSASESPLKRRHVEDVEPSDSPAPAPNLAVDPELIHSHRATLHGRATLSNAADSIYFSNHRALVFHFVDVFDLVKDELGKLVSCTLKCGICRAGAGWRWVKGGKSKGSTTNMILHMKDKHGDIWQSALHTDWVASGKPLESQNASAQLQAAPENSPVSSFLQAGSCI
jgi:hypothetical protein